MVLLATCQQTLSRHVTDQLADHGSGTSDHFRQIILIQLKDDKSSSLIINAEPTTEILEYDLQSFAERKSDELGVTFEQRRPSRMKIVKQLKHYFAIELAQQIHHILAGD